MTEPGGVQAGHSVLLHVKGFLPYFWVAAPKGFTNSDCAPLFEHLNVRRLFIFTPPFSRY